MNRSNSQSSSGWAIMLLCATALALGGCGRKSGLDLPPNASNASPVVASPAADTESEQAAQPSVFNPTYGSEAQPAAPKGRRKGFVLDPLID